MNTIQLRPENGGQPPELAIFAFLAIGTVLPAITRSSPTSMRADSQSVSRVEIERLWDSIRDQTANSQAGIFGPSSLNLKVNRDYSFFFVAGRASVLNVRPPSVAVSL